jgi:hypothetical protein
VAVGVEVPAGVDVNVDLGVGRAAGVDVGVGLGVGVPTTPMTMYFESLGMPLVKMLTKAGPETKLVVGVEVKEVSDQPAMRSTGR